MISPYKRGNDSIKLNFLQYRTKTTKSLLVNPDAECIAFLSKFTVRFYRSYFRSNDFKVCRGVNCKAKCQALRIRARKAFEVVLKFQKLSLRNNW